VPDQNNICLGGIIMSCENRKVAADVEAASKDLLYKKIKRTREELYSGKIRLVLWDTILEQLHSPVIGGEEQRGPPQLITPANIPQGTISAVG
jgi:hypothetical protein